MHLLPIRLAPGEDLRRALEALATGHGAESAFVLAGIGSLTGATLRFADERVECRIDGPLELLTLAGSLGPSGGHLHASVADAAGRVHGGHLGYGNLVRTTAEVLLVRLPEWSLAREHDAATGFDELVVRRRE